MRCTRAVRVLLFDTIVVFVCCYFYTREIQVHAMHKDGPRYCSIPILFLFTVIYRKSKILEEYKFMRCTRTGVPKIKDTRGIKVHAMHKDGPRFYCSIPFLFCLL